MTFDWNDEAVQPQGYACPAGHLSVDGRPLLMENPLSDDRPENVFSDQTVLIEQLLASSPALREAMSDEQSLWQVLARTEARLDGKRVLVREFTDVCGSA